MSTDDKPAGIRTCIYDQQQLQVIMEKMANQAYALVGKKPLLALIGILRRGAPLADRLTEILISQYGMAPPLRLDLKVKRYADDLTLLHPETQLTEHADHVAIDLSGYSVLVVDDVLYAGYSMLRVVEYLNHKNPTEIFTATLVDRIAGKVPVYSHIVGVHLQAAPGDIVECNVPPYEDDFKIELLRPTETAP